MVSNYTVISDDLDNGYNGAGLKSLLVCEMINTIEVVPSRRYSMSS
jgi:hypothetical protein